MSEVPDSSVVLIMNEIVDDMKKKYMGVVKWFSSKLGYGFITVCDNSEMKGKDLFVHHIDIKPTNSNYRTLFKGEYTEFEIIEGKKDLQAVNITGINNGPLLCDNNREIMFKNILKHRNG